MRRRGFWMRMARERVNLTQAAAAEALGLSGHSKSTLSAWENGSREPKASYMVRMAELYEIPVEILMTPPAPTAYEIIDARLDELRRVAGVLERDDWGTVVEGRGPSGGGGRAVVPGIRSA